MIVVNSIDTKDRSSYNPAVKKEVLINLFIGRLHGYYQIQPIKVS